MLEAVIFYVFALAAVVLGIIVVTRRNPIASAIALVGTFFFLAGMYAMLDAHFVAVIQLLVYAGAIMVLFIFVMMLLNLREMGEGMVADIAGATTRGILGLSAVGLVGIGIYVGLQGVAGRKLGVAAEGTGTIEAVGRALFGGSYLLPFEIASALLTVAMIGAVVIAKREI